MENDYDQGQQGYDGKRFANESNIVKLTPTDVGHRDYPDRERSRSPRPEYRDNGDDRQRDVDMGGRDRYVRLMSVCQDLSANI